MTYETPHVPCKSFNHPSGCTVWCMKGDLDCCVICCQRHTCDDICPKAKKLLKKPEWKDKHYAWEE